MFTTLQCYAGFWNTGVFTAVCFQRVYCTILPSQVKGPYLLLYVSKKLISNFKSFQNVNKYYDPCRAVIKRSFNLTTYIQKGHASLHIKFSTLSEMPKTFFNAHTQHTLRIRIPHAPEIFESRGEWNMSSVLHMGSRRQCALPIQYGLSVQL